MMKQSAAIPFRPSQPNLMPTSRGLLRLLIVTACLGLAQPFVVLAQTNAPAPLPPAAQEVLDKGIIAAKVPDYLLAIRYFEEARKLAPQAPVVYLNMGLAESRVPGRELRAMAWFGAYLSAYPDAPNSAAVQEQIAVLTVRNQSNVLRFLKNVQDAANLSDDTGENLTKVAKLWVKTGDIAAAIDAAREAAVAIIRKSLGRENAAIFSAISAEIKESIANKDGAKASISLIQAQAGDIAGALRTADLIQEANNQSWAQEGIAETQAKSGDIAGAQKTTGLIGTPYAKSRAQAVIAEAQLRADDIAAAKTTLASAQKTAELIQESGWKSIAMSDIAKVREKIGVASSPIARLQLAPPLPIQPNINVSDWLNKLDDTDKSNDCPLRTAHFLDLAGYLKSLTSQDAQNLFDVLFDAVVKMISAQNVITGMLKQQAKR